MLSLRMQACLAMKPERPVAQPETIRGRVASAILAASIFVLAAPATAQTVLTVTHDGENVEYDLSALQALPQTEFTTENPFIDGARVYSGPLLRDVLELSDLLDQEVITIRALNDYEIAFPVSDAIDFDVIIALKSEGSLMSIRDNGPLWLMYPVSDHSELNEPIYKSRMIWQLVEISAE